MISKQLQKYVQSLHNKKHRKEYGEFIVEGEKGLAELLQSDFEIKHFVGTEDYVRSIPDLKEPILCPLEILGTISTFKSNNAGLAIVKQKPNIKPVSLENTTLFLDEIKDPGNLGTIIRLADWYGVKNVVCSLNTVEFYNPKVISATMGSFARIHVYYTDLLEYFSEFPYPIYGADLEGKNVHKLKFAEKIGIVIGSESHGISVEVSERLNDKITIPRLGNAESLNAAIATGIILDNIFRDY